MQAAFCHPMFYGSRAVAELEKLLPRHEVVLFSN
jgi:hypothetical protein